MKERHIVEVFERALATSPDAGRAPSDLDVDDHGIGWQRLRDHAVVRESDVGSGLYYVDVEVWQALRRMRRRMIMILGIVLLMALLFSLGLLPR